MNRFTVIHEDELEVLYDTETDKVVASFSYSCPEDRTFGRDLAPAVDTLNRLNANITVSRLCLDTPGYIPRVSEDGVPNRFVVLDAEDAYEKGLTDRRDALCEWVYDFDAEDELVFIDQEVPEDITFGRDLRPLVEMLNALADRARDLHEQLSAQVTGASPTDH